MRGGGAGPVGSARPGGAGGTPASGSQREKPAGAAGSEAEPGFLHAPFVWSTAACGAGVAGTFISALPRPGGRAAGRLSSARLGSGARLVGTPGWADGGAGSGSAAVSMD